MSSRDVSQCCSGLVQESELADNAGSLQALDLVLEIRMP